MRVQFAVLVVMITLITSCGDSNNDVSTEDQNTQSEELATPVDPTDSTGKKISLRIAYVNKDTLVMNYKAFQVAQNRLEQKQQQEQGRLNRMEQKYIDEEKKVQEKVQSGMFTQSWLDTAQQNLYMMRMQMQQELGKAQERMAKELSRLENEYYSKVGDHIENFAKEKGYNFILSQSSMNSSVMYADETFDVTAEVLKRLNDEFDKGKAAE